MEPWNYVNCIKNWVPPYPFCIAQKPTSYNKFLMCCILWLEISYCFVASRIIYQFQQTVKPSYNCYCRLPDHISKSQIYDLSNHALKFQIYKDQCPGRFQSNQVIYRTISLLWETFNFEFLVKKSVIRNYTRVTQKSQSCTRVTVIRKILSVAIMWVMQLRAVW